MNAPDKIFCWRGVLGTLFCSLEKGTNTDRTEYIRRDVLVDKLYKWMDKETTVTDYYSKEDFKKVIDNLF